MFVGDHRGMRHLRDMLECDGVATPASTMGMGNPMAPEPSVEVGSGDIPVAYIPRKKKEKKKRN